MSNNAFFQKMAQISKQVPALVQRLPGIGKAEGLRFIADNFDQEGFETETGRYRVWPDKKKGSKKTLVGEKRGATLKRSWKQASTSNTTSAIFASPLVYAEVHNEGLKAGRPPGFQMPRRQMIGASEALNARIEKKIDELINKVFE